MNKYKVTDINNTSFLIKSEFMRVEMINNVEIYIAFYVDEKTVAILNLSNIISVVKKN